MQENIEVLSLLHSLKRLIASARNFRRTLVSSYVDLVLQTTKDFILKFSMCESFFLQQAFLS